METMLIWLQRRWGKSGKKATYWHRRSHVFMLDVGMRENKESLKTPECRPEEL